MQPNACIWLYPSRSIDAEGVNNAQRLLNNFEYLVIVKEAMHASASPLFIVTLYTVTGQILQPIPAQGRDDIFRSLFGAPMERKRRASVMKTSKLVFATLG
ncbi:MAG: hypothetical protein J6W51_09940 [Fibrobacter sp.]|nr:hypothetical protein [Fibrobacter sp.]